MKRTDNRLYWIIVPALIVFAIVDVYVIRSRHAVGKPANLGIFWGAVLVVPLVLGLFYVMFNVTSNWIGIANRRKTARIADSHDAERTITRVLKLSRRTFSPHMVVLTVDSAVWQQVITGLLAKVKAVLVDVSEPTYQVLWEIESLADHPGVRAVFVVDGQRVPQLTAVDDGCTDTSLRHLRTLLDGREVIAYTTSPDGIERFARAVRAKLEDPQPVRVATAA